MDFAQAHVLITGASRGLGRAFARQLAARGARLSLVARGPAPLAELQAAIQSAGGQAHWIAADVGDKHAIYRLVGEAAAEYGPVDMLIHAASTLGPVPLQPLLDTECEELGAVLETNAIGPFRLTKAVAGQMLVRGEGTVLAISSDAALEHYPTWGPYGASKVALDHLIATLAGELGPHGVRFISVDPGEMDTEMHAAAMPDADRSALRDPEDVARWVIARLADPQLAPAGVRWIAGITPLSASEPIADAGSQSRTGGTR